MQAMGVHVTLKSYHSTLRLPPPPTLFYSAFFEALVRSFIKIYTRP